MRDDCCEIAARTHTTNCDPSRSTIETVCVRCNPARCYIALFRANWKLVFGGEAIVHRDHETLHQVHQAPAKSIFRIEISNNSAAAMEIDQNREGTTSFWRIYSEWNIS